MTLRTGAVLRHPHGDFMGNLLWPGELPPEHLAALPATLLAITAKSYRASPFIATTGLKLPLTADKVFTKHMQPWAPGGV